DTLSYFVYLDVSFFFLHAPAPPELYTLSLHDALPIFAANVPIDGADIAAQLAIPVERAGMVLAPFAVRGPEIEFGVGRHQRRDRSEEHTSELQSRENLVCRLLLEKKKKQKKISKKYMR